VLQELRKNELLKYATKDTIRNHVVKRQHQQATTNSPKGNDADRAATISPDPQATVVVNKGGRPQGTTKEVARLAKEAHATAMEWAKVQLIDKREEVDGNQLPDGTLKALIKEANAMFKLTGGNVILVEDVRTRAKRGRSITGRMKSPLEAVEPEPIQLCQQLVRMGDPLDPPGFLQLANNIIVDTITIEKVGPRMEE
jgi:hypothetical protein